LLHYGSRDAPKFILIDGGPKRNTFVQTTASRLNELRRKFPNDEDRLSLEMVMVSHIDDDHIDGLLAMTDFLLELDEDSKPRPYDIRTFWFNSFDEILSNDNEGAFTPLATHVATAGLDAPLPGMATADAYAAAVVASANQGRRLRRNLGKLGIPINGWPDQAAVDEVERMVVRPEHGKLTIQWDSDLTLTILAPDTFRLKKLRRKWADAIEATPDVNTLAELAAFDDTSVANLSSIVVLAECGGKSMLLTGDARGDHIIEGVEAAEMFTDGRLEIDLLKLPHHGSDRNVTRGFFGQFPAKHYVASGNGEHGNPEMVKTVERMLERSRDDDDFTLHLTNRSGEDGFTNDVTRFLEAKDDRDRDYQVRFRKPDKRSIIVDLLDPVDY
jgi:hypothetical protein